MGYVLGQCPQCNNVMSMPDDSAIVRCPTCQSEVSATEAAALAGNADAMQGAQPQPEVQPQPTPPAGNDPYAQAAGMAGAQPTSAYTQPAPGYAPPPNQAPFYPQNTPAPSAFVSGWKTNTLFTILGIAASMVFYGLAQLGTEPDASGGIAGVVGILSLVYFIFAIVYAVKFYPAYFSDKPVVNSNEAASFLNGFVGGIIFGLLWNHNLTRREKGISHIVFVVLMIASIVLTIIAAFLLVGVIMMGMASV